MTIFSVATLLVPPPAPILPEVVAEPSAKLRREMNSFFEPISSVSDAEHQDGVKKLAELQTSLTNLRKAGDRDLQILNSQHSMKGLPDGIHLRSPMEADVAKLLGDEFSDDAPTLEEVRTRHHARNRQIAAMETAIETQRRRNSAREVELAQQAQVEMRNHHSAMLKRFAKKYKELAELAIEEKAFLDSAANHGMAIIYNTPHHCVTLCGHPEQSQGPAALWFADARRAGLID